MSKWLDKALAAVAADNASPAPILPNALNAKNAKIAKTPLPQRSEENRSQQHPPKPNFSNFDNFGKWQNKPASLFVNLPSNLVKAFAALRTSPCPALVSPDRWKQVLSDADRLLHWADVLVDMGWTLPEVLGRDHIDHLSLVWKVKGQRIDSVGKIATVLRGNDGSTTWVFRRVEE